MQEVVFGKNGKLVLQKRKQSQIDESFILASKELDKKNERLDASAKGFNQFLVKDFRFVEDSVFETMKTYFEEETNITNVEPLSQSEKRYDFKEQNYNELFRRKSDIEIKEQTEQIFRRKPTIKTNNQINRRESTLNVKDEITKQQLEKLIHNKIGKFVKETFKTELTQTNIESIEQHKYSRLSKGAYMTNKGETVELEQMLNEFSETKDFIVDTELTSSNSTIYHNIKTNETVIAFRGTDPGSLNLTAIEKTRLPNFSDLKTDGAILIGQEAKTERLLEAERTFQKTVNKYGKESLNLTGHSLGGNQALHIGEKFDIPSKTFNGAVSIRQVAEDVNNTHMLNKSEQIIYRTHLDPVSVGALVKSENSNRKVINIDTHLGKSNTILETHDIDHFIEEGAEIEEGVIKVSKASKMTQLAELTAGNKGNALFGSISAGVAYEMNKDKSKSEQVYRMGEAVADVSVLPMIESTDVLQSKALGGGFTTDEMHSAFNFLTGNYFTKDKSKSSNPDLNDSVVEDDNGLVINGVKFHQIMGQHP